MVAMVVEIGRFMEKGEGKAWKGREGRMDGDLRSNVLNGYLRRGQVK